MGGLGAYDKKVRLLTPGLFFIRRKHSNPSNTAVGLLIKANDSYGMGFWVLFYCFDRLRNRKMRKMHTSLFDGL